jgi:cell wall assembly regulator SMI1
MFLERFLHARQYLRQQGLRPQVVRGAPVSQSDIKAVDAETGFPMPPELRQFYLELGDGFMFNPDDTESSELIGWEPMHLEDHRICNKGFGSRIHEEVAREIGSGLPRTDPALLRQEMKRRKAWMPFYGFVGGGDYLCLDLGVTPPSVRFFEAIAWVAIPSTWDFVVAPSFVEFVERWGRYHFLSPRGGWTSYCEELSGQFDWAPEHFPQL